MPTRLAIVILAVTLVAACSARDASPGAGDGAIQVVATTTVLADLVAQVGGDRVEVTSLVPPGGEPHTFDPSPSDLRAVADADLIVMNGLGLDDWLRDLVADSASGAPIVVLGEGLDGVTYLAGGHEEPGAGHDDEPVNPHLWLDVGHARRYVGRIADALASVAPADATPFRDAAAAYDARLIELDTWARERLATVPPADRVVVSFHEAFPYFAAAYGLTIVGTVVDAPGQDPSAGEIAALVEAIRATGARAVLGEAQFDPDLIETVADEAGVPVVTDLYSDSLGDAPADTYEGLIRWDVDRIMAALGG